MTVATKSLFELAGGAEGLMKICKIFYDKIYEDRWISQYFADIPQEHIENQQADFMSGVLGGPKAYAGRFPIPAHEHMQISEELFEVRKQYLIESLNESGVSEEVAAAWLKLDSNFKVGIVKSREQCKKRYMTDEILDFQKPFGYRPK